MSKRLFKTLVVERRFRFLTREAIVAIGKDLFEGYFRGIFK